MNHGRALERHPSQTIALDVGIDPAASPLLLFGSLVPLLWVMGSRLDQLLSLPTHPAFEGLAGLAGSLMIVAGMAWAAWTYLLLRSDSRPRALVVEGPFALTRHPTYVGLTIIFSGAGLATGSVGRSLLATAALALAWAIYAITFEEPQLSRYFGPKYQLYSARTPFLPLLITGPGAALRGRPYGAPLLRATSWVGVGASLILNMVAIGSAVVGALMLEQSFHARVPELRDTLRLLDWICLAGLGISSTWRLVQLACGPHPSQRLRLADLALTQALTVLALGVLSRGAAAGATAGLIQLLYAVGSFALEGRTLRSRALTRTQTSGAVLAALAGTLIFVL